MEKLTDTPPSYPLWGHPPPPRGCQGLLHGVPKPYINQKISRLRRAKTLFFLTRFLVIFLHFLTVSPQNVRLRRFLGFILCFGLLRTIGAPSYPLSGHPPPWVLKTALSGWSHFFHKMPPPLWLRRGSQPRPTMCSFCD